VRPAAPQTWEKPLRAQQGADGGERALAEAAAAAAAVAAAAGVAVAAAAVGVAAALASPADAAPGQRRAQASSPPLTLGRSLALRHQRS